MRRAILLMAMMVLTVLVASGVALAVTNVVTCGSGFDRVIADRADLVAPDCEKVVVVHGSLEEVNRQADRWYASLPQAQREFFDTFFEEQLAPFPNG